MFTIDNPWNDEPENAHANAVACIHKFATKFEKTAPKSGSLEKHIVAFSKDLQKIASLFKKDPTLWRQHRALTIAHLPAIESTLTGLMDSTLETNDTRRKTIENDLKACLELTKPILAGAQDLSVMALETNTDLLMEQTGIAKPQADTKTLLSRGKGLFSSAGQHLTKVGSDINSAAQQTGTAIRKTTHFAAAFTGQTIGDGVDMIVSPVTLRFNALREGLAQTSMLALVAGGVTAIIFPPAAPLVAGLAVLEAPAAYREALEEEKKSHAKSRSEQERTTLKDAVSIFKSQPLMRLETNHVLVRIDTQTGESNGIILSGRYAGQDLSEISAQGMTAMINTAPDTQTHDILESWLKGH